MAEVYKLNNNSAIRNLESDLTEANKKIAYLQNELLETVIAEAEETYNEVGTMTTPSSVTIGSTAYSVIDNSKMELKEVLGKSQVWNQLINPSYYGYTENVENNVTFTNQGNGIIKVVVGSGGASALTTRGLNTKVQIYANHKYLLKGIPNNIDSTTSGIRIDYIGLKNSNSIVSYANSQLVNIWISIGLGCPAGTYIFNLNFIDLTQNGDDTLTLEQAMAKYNDFYPYDAGSIKDSTFSGVLTKDSNNTNLSQITFVPQTLRGIGTAQDKLVITKNTDNDLYTMKKVAYIGQIDLGTLTWTYNSLAVPPRFISYISSAKQGGKVMCLKYKKGNATTDKSIYLDEYSKGYVCVVDSSYTDTTTFKNAMSGVILYYELATPTETTLYTDLTYSQVSFLTQQGGTISVDNTSLAKGGLTLLETIKYFRSN